MPVNPAEPGAPVSASVAPDDVRRAAAALLRRPITTLEFTVEPIDPALRIHSVTAGVLRVRGHGDGDDFSLIIKQTHLDAAADPRALWGSSADQAHQHFWKREWLAYSSGLLGRLPGRLRAPRLLLATEPAENVAWMWLEDVTGRPGTQWQPQHFARAAHDLGTTQGAFAAGQPRLPSHAWLSRDWLAQWINTTAPSWSLVDDDAMWRDERLAGLAGLRPRARDLWAARDELLAVLGSAPQTLVHLDFWPSNLVAGLDGQTIAIDWSSVGIGALGQDLDQITLDPVWMQVLPRADLGLLERAALPAYAWGVRAAGHDASEAELRRWYAACAGLRYVSMLPGQAEIAADPARIESIEGRWGRPFEAVAADRERVITRALDLAEEALRAEPSS